jgi:hypothetical protein
MARPLDQILEKQIMRPLLAVANLYLQPVHLQPLLATNVIVLDDF